jgi:hypothetical protein
MKGLTRIPIQKAALVIGEAFAEESGSLVRPKRDMCAHDRDAVDRALPYD